MVWGRRLLDPGSWKGRWTPHQPLLWVPASGQGLPFQPCSLPLSSWQLNGPPAVGTMCTSEGLLPWGALMCACSWSRLAVALCSDVCMSLCPRESRGGGGRVNRNLPVHLAPLGNGTSAEEVVGGWTAHVACF